MRNTGGNIDRASFAPQRIKFIVSDRVESEPQRLHRSLAEVFVNSVVAEGLGDVGLLPGSRTEMAARSGHHKFLYLVSSLSRIVVQTVSRIE